MAQDENNWSKMSRMPNPSTKKAILDALCKETLEDSSEGKPDRPVLPLVGSMNVPVSQEEENLRG